jgi:hypothetical protein
MTTTSEPTVLDLLEQISAANERHIAAGLIVALRRDDLDEAIAAQNNTRQAVMNLRHILIAKEGSLNESPYQV